MELYTAITKGENITFIFYSHILMYMIGIMYCLLKEGSFMSLHYRAL